MNIAVEVALDLLIETGDVEVTKNEKGEEVYRLTEKGKRYAKKRKGAK